MLIAEDGTGHLTRHGYREIFDPSHPLAQAGGGVMEHRLVLYEKIGPGEHVCHSCGKKVSWEHDWGGSRRDGALVVDHLDFDKLNNNPDNLVPSCFACNARRHQQRRCPHCGGLL